MNLQDVTAHWVALHEALGVGAPVVSDAQYQQLLTAVDALVDATSGDEAHPLWGLISVVGDRIRDYEAKHAPWPDTSTPASVLIAKLRQRGASKPRTVKTLSSTVSSLFQKQLPEEELVRLLGELQTMGAITINDSKVTYALPEVAAE